MEAKTQRAFWGTGRRPPGFPQLCRYLAELSPQPMLAVEGPEHIVRYVNPAFCRLVGKESQDLLGHRFPEAVPEGMANGCGPLLDRVYRTGEPEALAEQEHQTSTETTASKTGQPSPTHLSYLAWGILFPDELSEHESEEKPVGVMIQVTDASEIAGFRKATAAINQALLLSGIQQHELAEALETSEAHEREARVESEDANRSKDLFMAVLSHELRTPLNAIIGWSEMLQEDGCDDGEWREGLEVIKRSARTQAQLLEDMLDVSRIVSGKLNLEIKPCELATIIRAVVESAGPAAAAGQIALSVELDETASEGLYDEARIQQVVSNLLTNAIKFTPRHGKVTVRLLRQQSNAVIEVSDTGIGLSPELRPFVFDRYRQADSTSTRRHGGLGLGLSIVKQIVELHGGRIEARSNGEGTGTTFTVTLPRREIPQGENFSGPENRNSPDSIPLEPVCEPAPSLDGLRILLVDDEADVRKLLSVILEHAGAVTVTAGSAARAMQLLEPAAPHLLVSDVGMPGEDGYDLIRKVRAAGYDAAKLPAVALTAFAGKTWEERALQSGYQIHIAKPVDPHRLIEQIAILMGRCRSRRTDL